MRQVTVDGRSARWDEHRAARRTELVQVARRTVHHEGPHVSMDDIAAAAGTSKSIVYRYFVDKTGLQIAVAEQVVADMRDALEAAAAGAATPREALRAMVGAYLAMVAHSPHVYYFVTRPVSEDASGRVGHFLEAVSELVAVPFARVLAGAVDGGAAATEGGSAVVVDAWAAGAVGFVRGVGEWWLENPRAVEREALAAQVTAWLWTGPVATLARSGGER